jgi:phage-related protein
LDISTHNWLRRALDALLQEHGAKSVATMAPRHVRKIRDLKAETPAAGQSAHQHAQRDVRLGK